MNKVRANEERERLLLSRFWDRLGWIIHLLVLGFPAGRKVALFPHNGNRRVREWKEKGMEHNRMDTNAESCDVD